MKGIKKIYRCVLVTLLAFSLTSEATYFDHLSPADQAVLITIAHGNSDDQVKIELVTLPYDNGITTTGWDEHSIPMGEGAFIPKEYAARALVKASSRGEIKFFVYQQNHKYICYLHVENKQGELKECMAPGLRLQNKNVNFDWNGIVVKHEVFIFIP